MTGHRAALSPKLATHAQATAFHPETGHLDLRPSFSELRVMVMHQACLR
ncbi:hypothetical protein [Streptomyces ziwulingensis]